MLQQHAAATAVPSGTEAQTNDCHAQVNLRTRAADVRQASKATVAAVEAKDTAQLRVSAAEADRGKAQSRLQEPAQVCSAISCRTWLCTCLQRTDMSATSLVRMGSIG